MFNLLIRYDFPFSYLKSSSLCLIFFLLSFPVFSQNHLILTDSQQAHFAGPHLDILADPGGALSIDNITSNQSNLVFQRSNDIVPNFGYTKTVYWIRLSITNASKQTSEWLLDQNYSNTHFLDLYSPTTEPKQYTVKQSGNLRPYSSRDIPHRRILFTLNIPSGATHTYYLRMENGSSMTMDFRLWSHSAFLQSSDNENFWQGMIYGIPLIMLAFNLFMLISLRDASFGWLVGFIVSIMSFASFYHGYAQQLIPDSQAHMSYLGTMFTGNMIPLTLLFFSRSFFQPADDIPTLQRIQLILFVLLISLAFSIPFMSYAHWVKLTSILTLSTMAFISFRGVLSVIKQEPASQLFVQGLLFMILSIVIFFLVRMGLIDSNILTENIIPFGVMSLVLFMSLAPTDRINQLRSQEQRALMALQFSDKKLATSNTKYRTLFESANEAIFLVNLEHIIDCNLKALTMFNCNKEDIIGHNINEFSPPFQKDGTPSRDTLIQKVQATLENQQQIFEWQCVRHDGSLFDVEVNLNRIELDNQVFYQALIRDITESKQLKDQLHRSQKMEALGKLTGGIAHDYNNMLGVILGFSELLETKLEDQPKLRDYAHRITQAGNRSKKLTQKLLSFSRHKHMDSTLVNLNSVLKDIQHMLEKILTASIKLELTLADDLWLAWLDQNDLEDALLNICINAMHAMPEGGYLRLSTANISLDKNKASMFDVTAGEYIQLVITDTGTGMNEQTLSKIFDPFFSTKGEGGTGLGMSQVYGFLKRSEGGIQIQSQINKGTCINLFFPRCKAQSTHTNLKSPELNQSTSSGTILVVDDEPALRELAENILRSHGYSVFSTENAQQALEILDLHPVDLVFTDIIMPDMNGYQLAAQVRSQHPNVAILLVSGYSDNPDFSRQSYSRETEHILQKPYSKNSLISKVNDLLKDKHP